MMNAVLKQIIRRSDGSALVELAIALPLIIMFFYGGFEYSRLIQNQNTLVAVSRQLGAAALRLCASRAKGAAPGGTLECLNTRIVNEIGSQIEAILPGVKFKVSVVRWNPNPGIPKEGAYIDEPIDTVSYPAGVVGKISKEYFLPDYPTPSEQAALLRDHEVLVYSEVFYENQPLFSVIPLLSDNLKRELYAVSVF
ncbi:MAG: pilus assembly protein [Candidatus Dadabacteria bacterium]|nr:MAG: pilus assembly protein [Candidatus Dadabacteria bacterium]